MVYSGRFGVIFYIILSGTFVTALFLYLILYLIRIYRRRAAENNETLTQEEANKIFEGPPLDLAQRCAN